MGKDVRRGAISIISPLCLNPKLDYLLQVISKRAPEYIRAIKAGKDARHIWVAFKAWRGEDAEGYFGALGNWAEGRLKDFSLE
jgi:hypothetical protein